MRESPAPGMRDTLSVNCSVYQRLGTSPFGLAGRNQLALPRRGVEAGHAFFLSGIYKANGRGVNAYDLFGLPGPG